ncbi:hypothetical protein HUJ05_013077 [Dendroctonus ponderosae]|uniref:Uncharacterized protein n=2 Tax=Dendroctonus ponderosae TaxID=77166 RepID=A0AAR5PD77_DENPD|nr:hypothetical protein HUJ05_013077 [Dendroctonus ponderosae]
MHESLIPVGPPKKRKSPRPRRNLQSEAGPSTSGTNNGLENHSENNPDTAVENKRIPMLIRGVGVHQVIPKEATRDVLTGKVPFYLVDDRDGVTLFPAKHNLVALKLDQEHVEKFEDYSCIGGHERQLKERPKRREGMGYRRRYISPELLNRGIYNVDIDIRIRALMLSINL